MGNIFTRLMLSRPALIHGIHVFTLLNDLIASSKEILQLLEQQQNYQCKILLRL